MRCIQQILPGIIRYGALHFSQYYLTDIVRLDERVRQDLDASGLTFDDLKKNLVVLDFRFEGQCDRVIPQLIQYFRDIPVRDIAVIFNSVVDTTTLDYPAISIPESVGDIDGWFSAIEHEPEDLTTDCDFLCLVRRASWPRARLVSGIIDLAVQARVSFGGMALRGEGLGQYQHLFPGHPLPILLDGPLIRGEPDCREHVVTSPLLQRCAVNVVCESSSQSGPEWKSWFITEKTFKPFGMRQIPIWWTVPGFVRQVAAQGFDVFNDIVDHSYDDIHDEDRRLQAVLAEIERLSQYNLGRSRKQVGYRLQGNRDLLQEKIHRAAQPIDSILKEMGLL